jgi:hypothetical protein
MFVNSIDLKPLFTKPDGTAIRDLTQTMLDLKSRAYVTYKVFKVPRDYVMRPDLISRAVYNNSLYAEIILKYNGISNPFSIDENDVILIPDLNDAEQKIKTPESAKEESIAEKIRNSYKYIDPLKIPTNGEALKQYNRRQIVDTPAGALPPNFNQPGTSQVRYKGGRVYFGEGAETCLEDGISIGEFLTNVITNRRRNNNTNQSQGR